MPRKDLPCAHCGTLMWRSRSSLPEGEAMCRPCRSAFGKYAPRPCVTCGLVFKPGSNPDQRACSNACRVRSETTDSCDDCGTVTDRGRNQAGRFCADCSKRRERERDARKDHGWTKSALLPSVRSLASRDGYRCHVCGEDVDMQLPYNDRMAPTRDHIVPRRAGGGHDPSNLKLAHRSCNSRRGAPLPV